MQSALTKGEKKCVELRLEDGRMAPLKNYARVGCGGADVERSPNVFRAKLLCKIQWRTQRKIARCIARIHVANGTNRVLHCQGRTRWSAKHQESAERLIRRVSNSS